MRWEVRVFEVLVVSLSWLYVTGAAGQNEQPIALANMQTEEFYPHLSRWLFYPITACLTCSFPVCSLRAQ